MPRVLGPGFNWHVKEPIERIDRFGYSHADGEPWISGAIVAGGPGEPDLPGPPPLARPPSQLRAGSSSSGGIPTRCGAGRRAGARELVARLGGLHCPARGMPCTAARAAVNLARCHWPPATNGIPRYAQVLWRWRRRVAPHRERLSRWKQYQEGRSAMTGYR